jgi:hypothetical protein
MKVWLVIPGIALIVAALHDLFHTLFHPAGRGAISDWLSRAVFCVIRKFAKRKVERITLAGPLAILTIMLTWVAWVVFGFAFLYYPFIATQFVLAPGLDLARHHSFLDAFNVSLGTLITVGGDFLPKSRLIRLGMGLEATLGFGILTASVSWLLSIYPALERRRTLAHEVSLLHFAETNTGLRLLELPESEAQDVLWGFATAMSSSRNDLTQFPVIYYFRSGDKQSSFAGSLSYFAELADAASQPARSPGVRMAGIALGGALNDYLEFIAETFIDMPKHDKQAIIQRYADEFLREPIRLESPSLRRAS